jgi:hypothetical protein
VGLTGVDVGTADAELKNLNAIIGQVQGNIGKAKQATAIFAQALKITPEQLRSFHDVKDLLPEIAEAIKNTGSDAEKAAIAKRFGIEDLLPLLKLGKDGFNELAAEANKLGVVLDSEMISGAAKAAEKMKALDDVMQAQKNKTFVQYAGTLIAIKTAFEQATVAVLKFLSAITNTRPADEQIAHYQKSIDQFKKLPFGEVIFAPQIKRLEFLRDKLATETSQARYDEMMREKAAQGKPATQLVTTPPKAGPKDETIRLTKEAFDAYQSSLKDLASAQAALTDDILTRAQFEKDAVDAELVKKQGDLDLQIDKVNEARKKGVDADADNQIKTLEATRTTEQKVAFDKKLLIDRQAELAIADKNIADQIAVANLQAEAASAQSAHLTALAGLADTARERNTYELAALNVQQKADVELADAKIAEAQAHLDAAERAGVSDTRELQRALQAAIQARGELATRQADQTLTFAKSHENPLQRYLDGIKDVDTAMQEWAVGGLNDLAQGFAKAVVEGGKLTDVAKSIFQKIAEDLIQSFVEQQVTKPIASFLADMFAFAASGDMTGAAGGMTVVGEQGPEIVNLPGGSRVLSNSQLRQVGMSSGSTAQQVIMFDNRGAVIWEQAARTMMQYADRSAATAGMTSMQASRRVIPADFARSGGRSLY